MSKKSTPSQQKDPFATREAKNYDNPIASRELILEVIAESSGPLSQEHIQAHFGYEDDERKEALRRRLRAMLRDHQLFQNRRGGFVHFDHSDLIRGRVQAHPDGFGFLIPDEGGDDVFLHAKQMRSLLNGDRAAVKISGYDERRKRNEGTVIEVLERAHERIVGRYFRESGIDFVVPEDKRITQDVLISPDYEHSAQEGQIVLVRILEYPTRYTQAIAMIESVLGDHQAPGMEVTIAVNTHSLPHQWPDEVMSEAAALGAEVREEDKHGRYDVRHLPLVTIDGEDARDFDDAVYCEPLEKGWRLLVAIADVSHYVAVGNGMDKEAEKRGTSVYFPGEVIPMLPESLSNGLCSLNPHVDRLCMLCEMEIGSGGALKSAQFHQAVMHSHARLTYTQVADMLFEGGDVSAEHEALMPHLQHLKEVYRALLKSRKRRGAIDFETTEVRFQFNESRKIDAVVPLVRNEAHRLIEECMVTANVATAQFLKKHKRPALFRNHEGSNPDKLPEVQQFLGRFGVHMSGEKASPRQYAEVLRQIQGWPEFEMIQTVLLRSLLQASYSPASNVGHFGLALKDYAHFTSPIRRYPDLLVHRAIRAQLQGEPRKDYVYSDKAMEALGEQCSRFERRADDATRDASDWLKCEFMQAHIGNQYEGVVAAVTSFGLFVQIKELMIDGLVHVTSLQREYYVFDPAGHRLIGEQSGRVYRLGDVVDIEVMRVNMEDRKIDFDLLGSRQEHFDAEAVHALQKKKKDSRKGDRKPRSESKNNSSDGDKKAKPKRKKARRKNR